MEFTCPHCHKSFQVKTRKVSMGTKAQAARRRNALKAAKAAQKVSDADLLKIYGTRDKWNWQDFVNALKVETGVIYSRWGALAVLRKLRAGLATEHIRPVSEVRTKFRSFCADEAVAPDTARTSGKKVATPR